MNKPKTSLELKLAEKEIKNIKSLYRDENYDKCISCIYYAIYHCCRAVMYTIDKEFSSHAQTIGNFNKYFTNTKLITSLTGARIKKAMINRDDADYRGKTAFTKEDVDRWKKDMNSFYKECRAFTDEQIKKP